MSEAVIGEVDTAAGQEQVRYERQRSLVRLASADADEVVIESRVREGVPRPPADNFG